MYAATQMKRVIQMSLMALALSFGTAGLQAQTTGESGQSYTVDELEALVGRVALYPDDLLAIVLPASTYPVQVVQAARFLEKYKKDSSLQSDESWDDSIVALLNYPEVIELMNTDLDWTWMLGDAVINQQPDVLEAIQIFRRRAWSVGNLNSDDRQLVSATDDAIEITQVEKEIIYIPYYQPERVIVYQPAPVYYYYPRAYPLYYYPYPAYYSFSSGYFWGVTTAFTFGWPLHRINVYQHHYRGHPYYNQRYRNNYTVRRHNDQRRVAVSSGRSRLDSVRHQRGDQWKPGLRNGVRPVRGAAVDRRHRAQLTDGKMKDRQVTPTQLRRTTERQSNQSRNQQRKKSNPNTSRRQNLQIRQSLAGNGNTSRANKAGVSRQPGNRTRLARQIQAEAKGRPQRSDGVKRNVQENRAARTNAPAEPRKQQAQKHVAPSTNTSSKSHSGNSSGSRSKQAAAPVSRNKSARSGRSHDRQSSGRSTGHRAKGRARAR